MDSGFGSEVESDLGQRVIGENRAWTSSYSSLIDKNETSSCWDYIFGGRKGQERHPGIRR